MLSTFRQGYPGQPIFGNEPCARDRKDVHTFKIGGMESHRFRTLKCRKHSSNKSLNADLDSRNRLRNLKKKYLFIFYLKCV